MTKAEKLTAKMMRASWGLPVLARSSVSRDWASVVSETTACSITGVMLPAPQGRGLPLPELEAAALGLLVLSGRLARDQLGQLLDASADGALGVGQDQDLALHRCFVRLGAVEVDLHRQLLLQGPDHVFLAHHRLRDLVVEGQNDAAGDDVEHIGEDAQQLTDVLERRQLGSDQDEHAL